jgi:hypothetical protein
MLLKILESIEQTRDLLLRESHQAGAQGDWNLARKLIDLAEQADRLRTGVQNLSGETSPVTVDMHTSPSAVTAEEYPRFFIRDGLLVKLGRQRDGTSEYEHSVPKDRYERILGVLRDMAAGRRNSPQKPFRFEIVQSEVEYPQYQARVVMSLLIRKGLLLVARKGSYRFASPATFESDVANLWNTVKGEHE